MSNLPNNKNILDNGEVIWLYGTPTKEIKHIDYKHGIHIKAKAIPLKQDNQVVRVNGKIQYKEKNDDAIIYKVRVIYTGSKRTGDAVCAKSNARITGSNGETVLINVFEKPFVLVRQMKYNSSLAISSSSSSGSGSRSSSSSVC